MKFLGIDWSEAHHDLCLVDEPGRVLARARIPDGIEGVARLHALVAEHIGEDEEILVGIELDRGLLVGGLVAADYDVYAINPLSVDRYRDRHSTSGAKSDPGDAKLLADIVRTDRHNLRKVAGDSDLAEGIKVLARAHKDLIASRTRQANRLRNQLREFYPAALKAFGSDLADRDALAVLGRAPSPKLGRRLSEPQIAAALRRGGRQRNVSKRAAEIAQALRSEQLQAPAALADAYAAAVRSGVAVLAEIVEQIAVLEDQLQTSFRSHPDAEIYLSLPGLGDVLGARALGEFGDDRTRYTDARARRPTREPRPSPKPQAPSGWCLPGSRATPTSLTHATSGRSRRCSDHQEHGATTTRSGHEEKAIIKLYASSLTASSGSSTPASPSESLTVKTSPGPPPRRSPLDSFRSWDV